MFTMCMTNVPPLSWQCPFIVFNSINMEQAYSTSPWSEQFMAAASGSLWYNHLYNLTAVSLWGYLTWQMGCVVTEMGCVCVCVSLCTDWPVWGEAGPVSGRRRCCATVHQPLCHPDQPHTHSHIQRHSHEEIYLLCSYPRNYFVINTLIQTLCCVPVLPSYSLLFCAFRS